MTDSNELRDEIASDTEIEVAMTNSPSQAQAIIAAALDEYAEGLRVDTARINWIESLHRAVIAKHDEFGEDKELEDFIKVLRKSEGWMIIYNHKGWSGDTFRDTVDAAMQVEPSKQE